MFGRIMSPVHTVVRDAIETSGASDDNDVPIYVIESNVRHKLKLDIERAKNEEKRLRDLEKSLRRREVLKKLLCGLTESRSMERLKSSFRILQFKKSNSEGSIDVERSDGQDLKHCKTNKSDKDIGDHTSLVTNTSEVLSYPGRTSEIKVSDLHVEDLEAKISSSMTITNKVEDLTDNCFENDDNVDSCDSIDFVAFDDPHLKHVANGSKEKQYVITCLDCRVEKAVKDVQEEMKESLALYCETNCGALSDCYSEESSIAGLDTSKKTAEPDLTTKQTKRRRKKKHRASRKEERKKRRKGIEDLIRLEGELNTGMGHYAMAFDTQSDPVKEHTADEMRRFVAAKEGIEFPDELALVTITLILLIVMSDYII